MAEFRTGYLQAMIPFDVAVTGTVVEGAAITSANRNAAILRGDLVVLTPAAGDVPAYITKATTLAEATHIVALTDMTLSDRKVNTELRDYRVSDLVGATREAVTEAKPILKTDKVKKVSFWPLFDKNDIKLDADGNDLKVGG